MRGVGKVEIVGNLKHLHIITFEEAAVKWAKHTRQKECSATDRAQDVVRRAKITNCLKALFNGKMCVRSC